MANKHKDIRAGIDGLGFPDGIRPQDARVDDMVVTHQGAAGLVRSRAGSVLQLSLWEGLPIDVDVSEVERCFRSPPGLSPEDAQVFFQDIWSRLRGVRTVGEEGEK